MLHRRTNAGTHARVVLGKLINVVEQRSSTRQHDAANKLALKAGTADFPNHIVQDFFHPCLNDTREVLFGNLLVVLTAQAGNGDDPVVVYFLRQCGAKLHFQFLCLWLHHGAAFLDVFGDHIAAKGNYRSVPDDAFLEDGNIRGATTDVNECHAGFLLFLTQHRRS